MRISFWHFVLLILVVAVAYYFYQNWWVQQDQKGWAHGLHNYALDSPEEMKQDPAKTSKGAKEKPVERDANGWIK